MTIFDPRIDTYILNASSFSIPIMSYLREIVHQVCPDVKETIKWSMPFFEYKGVPLCQMAAFKNHASFGFWLASNIEQANGLLPLSNSENSGMGQLGKLTKLSDLPHETMLIALIKSAMKLTDQGVKLKKSPQKELSIGNFVIPSDILDALESDQEIAKHFNKFSLANQKEYVDWITGAKREETRVQRLNTMLEWVKEGKVRNWKYIKK